MVCTFAPLVVDRVCDLTLLFIFFKGTQKIPIQDGGEKDEETRGGRRRALCRCEYTRKAYFYSRMGCLGRTVSPPFPRESDGDRAL